MQQLLLEVTNKDMDINDPRAQRVTRKVGEIIAIDCHTLSVVEDVSFNRVLTQVQLSQQEIFYGYYSQRSVKDEVKKLLSSDKPVVSITTDIWSCSSNDTSLLSLIAHWINK